MKTFNGEQIAAMEKHFKIKLINSLVGIKYP